MTDWDAWIGREQRASDRLDEGLASRWLATFDLAEPSPTLLPRYLPQGIHLALCTPDAPTAQLGEDGHPTRNDSPDSFLPPVPLPRRMWAASAIDFISPIPMGASIVRTSRVVSVTEKSGGSGQLVFVEVEHETSANGTLAVRETQTLVYRDAAPSDAPLSPPELREVTFDPSEWDAHRAITPDPLLLFRYSALTFNTHRIHFDAPYARDIERYRGLVVHGPLTASLLLQLAANGLGDNTLRSFSFRGVSPAIANEPLHLVMRGSGENIELGAFAADGRHVMKASGSV
ncbi:MAG: MaoC family dehydratase N-terminal domain-containing protein [Pseudomonadota bacterium]